MSFYSEAIKLIDKKDADVVSFDFFDTLMYRSVEDPKDIFHILGERLISKGYISSHISPQRFKTLREAAEVQARKKSKNREVKILDIYKELPFVNKNIKLSSIVREEIDVESKNLNALHSTLALMVAAKKIGKKVIVISDTYFSSDELFDFLPKKYASIIDKFYASSELGVGKGSGSFSYVLEDLKTKAEKVVHFGDNYVADVEIPSKLGLTCLLLPNGTVELAEIREREFELFVRKNPSLPIGPISFLSTQEIKAAHFMEMSNTWDHKAYGLYVLGPIFSNYCNWVINQINATPCDAVLSVMREGFLLEKIVKTISPKLVNLSKVYLSRKILFKSSIGKISITDIKFAFANPMASNISASADLINLSVDELMVALCLKKPSEISSLGPEAIYEKISSNKKLLNLISSRSSALRGKLVEHLKDVIGSPNFKKIALLDLGWNTTIQALLFKCLQLEGLDVRVDGYYLMTTATAGYHEVPEKNHTHGFLVNCGFPELDYSLISRNLEILEQACCPEHGSIIDYDDNNKPVVSASPLSKEQIQQVKKVQDGVMQYAKFFILNNPEGYKYTPSYVEYLRAKIIRAMLYPTANEVKLFESWQHDDNLFGSKLRHLFDDESSELVNYATLSELANIPMTDVYWPAGAIAKVDQNLSKIILYSAISKLNLTPHSSDYFCDNPIKVILTSVNGELKTLNLTNVKLNLNQKAAVKFSLSEFLAFDVRFMDFVFPSIIVGVVLGHVNLISKKSDYSISYDVIDSTYIEGEGGEFALVKPGQFIEANKMLRFDINESASNSEDLLFNCGFSILRR